MLDNALDYEGLKYYDRKSKNYIEEKVEKLQDQIDKKASKDDRITANTDGFTLGGKTTLILNKNLYIADDGGVSKTVIMALNPTPDEPVENGSEIIVGGGGNVFLGGGESYVNLINTLSDSETIQDYEIYDKTKENLYLASDSSLHLYSDCNEIGQRKVITMLQGNLYPGKNNSQNLGTATRAWSSIYNKDMWLYNGGNWQGYFGNHTEGTTDTIGDTRLVLGNKIASGNDGNSKGTIFLYGENTGFTQIIPTNHTEYNAMINLPSTGGTLALTSDTVESANKIKSIQNDPITESWYLAPMHNFTNSDNKIMSFNNGYAVGLKSGTTSEYGYVALNLGNNKAEGTEGNQRGCIRIYDKTAYKVDLFFGDGNSTDDRIIYLPDASGELALNTVASTSANGLMSSNDKSKLDNTNVAYGTCSTAADTAAKVITISGNTKWTLKAGSTIIVKFTETNTAQNPTFNVNNTGAKSVFYNTAVITTSNLGYAGYKDRPMQFVYDGTQYVFMGWSIDTDTNTKNTTGTTNKSNTKLFLAGATSQGANPTTYSNANVYIGTDNCLYSNGKKTATQELYGKTAIFFGDSITWGALGGDTSTQVANPYPTVFGNITGCTAINAGVGGATASTSQTNNFAAQITAQKDNIPNADYVFICFGVNDFSRSYDVGNALTPNSFYANYLACIKGILMINPNVEIVIILPPRGKGYTNNAEWKNSNGDIFDSYINATIEIATYLNLRIVDFGKVGINMYNVSTYYPSDNNHLTQEGYTLFGEHLAKTYKTGSYESMREFYDRNYRVATNELGTMPFPNPIDIQGNTYYDGIYWAISGTSTSGITSYKNVQIVKGQNYHFEFLTYHRDQANNRTVTYTITMTDINNSSSKYVFKKTVTCTYERLCFDFYSSNEAGFYKINIVASGDDVYIASPSLSFDGIIPEARKRKVGKVDITSTNKLVVTKNKFVNGEFIFSLAITANVSTEHLARVNLNTSNSGDTSAYLPTGNHYFVGMDITDKTTVVMMWSHDNDNPGQYLLHVLSGIQANHVYAANHILYLGSNDAVHEVTVQEY